MRRPPTAALIGVLVATLVICGALVAEHQAHLDLLALEGAQVIDAGASFSRLATDRRCPGLSPDEVPPPVMRTTLRLVPVTKAEQPTSVALLPDGSGNGYLSERAGRVRRITAGAVTAEVVLDLTPTTFHSGDGGMLALAIDPAGHWLYVERTQLNLDDAITAYPIETTGGLDVSKGREIIRSGHPSSIQHHGGSLAFDREGRLYFGFGDGGGLGDPRENAQRLTTLLGKINRIVPTPEAKRPYAIPPDNPFVDQKDIQPEIWAYGVRNPFRLSYDPVGDTVWLGDVGQSCWEEIDRLPVSTAGGSNLGWDVLEGTHDFEDGTLRQPIVAPVFDINHRHGWCAIAAGPVQRGDALPSLKGRLLVSDYCKGALWAIDAEHPDDVVDTGLKAGNVIAVVRGPAGRPWLLTLGGDIFEVSDT